jgi:hypothetical protein
VYSHCLFCQAPFGTNQTLELLPVGRRIAFDEAKGRLWVVCRSCARWNLTPFEDRPLAIEDCERRFRATVVRVSTDNVGLARLPEGLELVRIGKPLRPEFAAWRYGPQFLRRHHRSVVRRAARALTVPGLVALTPALALMGPLPPVVLAAGALGVFYHRLRRPEIVLSLGDDRRLELSADQVRGALLIRDDTKTEGWAIMFEHLKRLERSDFLKLGRDRDPNWAVLYGQEARLAASLLLPKLNPLGGDESRVSEAVRWIEASGGPERAFRTFARSHLVRLPLDNVASRITTLHPEVRLALEMALHEEEERRALAGELSVLEWVWRHEEPLAELADGLAVPADVTAQLETIRRQAGLPT